MSFFFSRPKRRNFYQKSQLKKYQSGMFTNPYFQSQTPKRLWFSIFIGLFFGFSIGLTSFFFTSPFFHLEFKSFKISFNGRPYILQTWPISNFDISKLAIGHDKQGTLCFDKTSSPFFVSNIFSNVVFAVIFGI